MNWIVRCLKVRFDVEIENIATATLYGVVKGLNVDSLSVFKILEPLDIDVVVELGAQVVTRNLVHLDFAFINFARGIQMSTMSRRFSCLNFVENG